MSVQNEIDRINNNIANTYATLNEAGATMPAAANSNNLSSTAASIAAVLYNKAQSLSDTQKQRARNNIGAISEVDVPKKGVDYFTPADQESIVQQVIAAMGTPVYGTVGEKKTIILEADLGEGTYTFMLKKDDGSLALIGTGEYQSGPKYTNALTKAIGTDGQPYNGGKGWKDGYRLNSSAAESADAAADVTGFIPAKWGDTLYLSGVTLSGNSKNYIYVYDSSFTNIGAYFRGDGSFATAVSKGGITLDESGNAKAIKLDGNTFDTTPSGSVNTAYVRFSCDQITDDSIVTVNEPIE